MTAELRDTIAQVLSRHQPNEWGQHDGWWECCCQHGGPTVVWSPQHQADAVLAALHGRLFTPDDARLFRRAIDWIASELRDQGIEPGEYLLTRTMLNDMITRFDEYAALVGSETPWVAERGES